jgi:type VI secretion system protein ImpL
VSIKTVCFALFLYICLVWVIALRIRTGPEIQDFGLLWTGVGLLSVLAFIICARLFGWWRLRRARAVTRPVAPTRPVQAVHEDDAALTAMISQANSSLAKSPAYSAAARTKPFCGLPLYILFGPEGSGKTGTFLNSGTEPQLLAGESSESKQALPTLLCNLWLARDAVFAELSGRAFSGDPARWRALLRGLQGKKSIPAWKRLWGDQEFEAEFRGAIGFCDVKEFIGASSDPQRFERQCRDWHDRLHAMGEVFGIQFPVYQVISKCDVIPFFEDYFRRLTEVEATQVLGSSLPLGRFDLTLPGDAVADAEARRLTASFRRLYRSIAQRRVSRLANERQQKLRPGIYEFPRELKRVRTSLVHFLTDAFRPDPLQPGPLLRGYYLTGTRQLEVAPEPLASGDWGSGDLDASRLFRGDATRFIDSGTEYGKGGAIPRRGVATRWIFVSDLFHRVLPADRGATRKIRTDPRIERYRQLVFAGVSGFCVLLCLAFGTSWVANRGLLSEVEAAAMATGRQGTEHLATLTDLASLDALRLQLERLREGPGLRFHWGLYTGNRVQEPLRRAYFDRFQRLLLNHLNARMVNSMAALPGVPVGSSQSDAAYRQLKTHLMITQGSCSPDPAYIESSLKQESRADEIAPGRHWLELADRQISFYASEFTYGNPCQLREDAAACARARQYLQASGGVEEVYRATVSKLEQSTKPLRLGDLASNYSQVLAGQGDARGIFSPEGWKLLVKASKERTAPPVDACVTGHRAVSEGDSLAIQRSFIRDYADNWRKYLAEFSVLKYSNAQDAARKLDILSDHRSPLLALFALVATQTQIVEEASPAAAVIDKFPTLGKYLNMGEAASKKAASLKAGTQGVATTEDLGRSFQPVHWVVPPGSENWVIPEKNGGYIDALGLLRRSMQDIAQDTTTGKASDPAIYQAANQNYEKALDAARNIEKGFKPVDVDGVDTVVQRLLEEPIYNVRGLIVLQDPGEVNAKKVNGELKALCQTLSPVLGKYPFKNGSATDATLAEFNAAFAPATGWIQKFEAQSLAELAVKDGPQWKAKDPAAKPKVTPDLLAFLNNAQKVTDAFYSSGAVSPQLNYALAPTDPVSKDRIIEFEVDGQVFQWISAYRHGFTWPAPAAAKEGAVGRIRGPSGVYPFASEPGTWAIFRILRSAEPRQASAKTVEWKFIRARDGGRLEPIEPSVRLDISEFPKAVDVFHPSFFSGLTCSTSAAH